MKKFLFWAFSMTLIVCHAGQALAEGFGLYEWSARSLALGGATVARKRADPSVVASNPALMTKLKGAHVMAGVSAVAPRGDMVTRDDSGSEKCTHLRDAVWALPHAYYTQQVTDRLFIGVGEFTRFGLGFDYPKNWPGRFNIYSISLQTASINPNVALAVTDSFSVAAGVEVMYFSLDLNKRKQQRISPNPAVPQMEYDVDISNGDSVAVGYNLAAHLDLSDEWSVGLSYRSQMRHKAKGDNEFSLVNGAAIDAVAGPGVAESIFNANFHDGRVRGNVTLPESIAFGVAYQPREDLSFEAGAIWTRWGRFKNLTIDFDDPMNISSTEHKDWKNAWRLNFGVEYDVNDWLTLRAGYIFDQSPMTEQYEDYLVPTDDRNIYSIGAGFRYEQWTFDLAYAYIDARSRHYRTNYETHTWEGKSNGDTSIYSLSVGYEF